MVVVVGAAVLMLVVVGAAVLMLVVVGGAAVLTLVVVGSAVVVTVTVLVIVELVMVVVGVVTVTVLVIVAVVMVVGATDVSSGTGESLHSAFIIALAESQNEYSFLQASIHCFARHTVWYNLTGVSSIGSHSPFPFGLMQHVQ